MKEYTIDNPCPDLISYISIQEFRRHQFKLTLCFRDKDTNIHCSGTNTFNLESEKITHWNIKLENEIFNKIESKSYRRFESREGNSFSVIYIPTIYFMSKAWVKKIEEKALTNSTFKSYLL